MSGDPPVTRNCDVLVVGSGAAGLATAVASTHFGLKLIVAEKAAVFGGISAWSGGLSIPRNPLARAAGIEEVPSPPRRHPADVLGSRAADPRTGAFLAAGPEMVEFFAWETAVEWIGGNAISDFHDLPDSAGRGVGAAPADGPLRPTLRCARQLRRLGCRADRHRPGCKALSRRG